MTRVQVIGTARRHTPHTSIRTRPLIGVAVALALVTAGIVAGRLTAGHPADRVALDGSARRTLAGVPVGHPPTRAGAVAAAADYVQALATVALAGDRQLAAAHIQTLTRPAMRRLGSRARLQARTARAALALQGRRSGARAVTRHVPVGARLLSFQARSHAEVALWSVDVMAVAGGPPARAWWMTERLQLRWQGDRWRIDSAQAGSGPVPISAQGQPSSAAALDEQLSLTRELRHAG